MEKHQNDIPAVRRVKISDLVKRQGIVRVNELSDVFGVSVITIRRDLDILEKKGLLERTHGGAINSNHFSSESPYIDKRRTNIAIKQAIGEKAASFIDEEDALLINSGTTTAEVIKAIQFKKNVRVITNNVAVTRDLHPDASLEVIFTGGSYRSNTCCVVGEFADLMIENVYASKTILGVDGLSFKNGLTSPNYQEALISRKMIQHSQGPVIIVADHSKIGKVTNFSIASLEQISAVITDTLVPNDVCREFEKTGITMHLVDAKEIKWLRFCKTSHLPKTSSRTLLLDVQGFDELPRALARGEDASLPVSGVLTPSRHGLKPKREGGCFHSTSSSTWQLILPQFSRL